MLAALCLRAANVYDFSLISLDGKQTSLKTYQGKVLLIVNVASRTIYSEQIEKLETLYRTYRDQGLVVIGIPSNDFGHGEPGDASAVKAYYIGEKHVGFPVFAKASLAGRDCIPLYEFLTDAKLDAKAGGELPWNFCKYLIGRDGNPISRFDTHVQPDSPELMVAVEAALEQKANSKKANDAGQ